MYMTLTVACVVAVALLLFPIANAAFDVAPASATVSVDETAEFRCQHSTANSVDWMINGSMVDLRSLPPDVRVRTDVLLSICSIVAREVYNGTEVVCVAGGDMSNTAVLYIIAGTGFLTFPLSVNIAVGTDTMFYCEHSSAESYILLINGTALNERPEILASFRDSTSGHVHTPTVTALPQYNSTMIECIAFVDDQPSERTPPALLLLQGPLDVVDLTNVNSTISWDPPFSLDLTNIEPDIVYCVDVYNITCGERDLVSSDCSVTDTNYTSLSDGYLYEYSVTPRSNVDGAQNGTESLPLIDTLPTFSPSLSELHVSFGSSDLPSNYQIALSYTPDLPIPSSYTLSLEALDGLRDLDHVEATATEIRPILLLSVTGLELRRLWNATILAFGCEEHSLLFTLLSTHDFQDISISSPSAGVVRVTGRFVEGSPATGVLVIVSGDSGVTYHISTRDDSGSHAVTIPGLAGGDYTVAVFVVEENGLPFERAAITPKHLSVQTNTVEPPSPTIEYSVKSASVGLICVECNFLDGDVSECVAVVHDRDLTNIESSHKFTRSGDTASGCIEGVNLEDYQVGVVDGRLLTSGPAHSSDLTVIIIIVLIVIVALLAVIVIVLSIIVKVHYRKYQNHTGPGDVEKIQNHYVPTLPTENPRVPLVVRASVGIYASVSQDSLSPSSTPSSSFNDSSHAGTISGASSAENGNTPFYSSAGVNQQPCSPGDPIQTSTYVVDSAKQDGISPLYSQVDVKPQSVGVPPVDDEQVVYSEVMKTQGASNQLYAMVNPKKKSTRESYLDDLTKVVYSEIRPHGVEQPPQATTRTPTPFTLDNIVTALLPVASKWQAIEEAFPLSQKWLYDTEIEDEQCLQEVIKAYMLRHDLSHTWDEIVDVLKKIEEDSLAEEIFSVHVAPYVLTLPNRPQLPKRDLYTHGSKPLSHNVSTDDGSLDTASPVLSGQQTEPATSVSSEREVKLDKEESLPTPGETCTPESHHGGAVLEMPSYDDDVSSSESKGEATGDILEKECGSDESSKGRVGTDGDSGVCDGRESSLTLEREDDMSSQLTDADSSSIESVAKASSDVEKATHIVTAKPAQVARELSQEDYKSEVPLPSGSNESQCGKSGHGEDPLASTSEIDSSFETPKRLYTQEKGVSDGKGNSSHGFDESGYLTASCQSTGSSVDNITATQSTLCTPSSRRDYKAKGRHLQVDSPDMLAQNRSGQENLLVEDRKPTALVTQQPKSRDQLAKVLFTPSNSS